MDISTFSLKRVSSIRGLLRYFMDVEASEDVENTDKQLQDGTYLTLSPFPCILTKSLQTFELNSVRAKHVQIVGWRR